MTDKRVKTIKIRVSQEEFDTLKWRSTKSQLATWMRDTCLNYEQGEMIRQSKKPTPVDPSLLRQLARLGNNLNQIARRVNSKDWATIDRLHVVAALAGIERELEELRAQHR